MIDRHRDAVAFVSWLEFRVIRDARGDELDRLEEVAPRDRLWLGRLASETAAREAALSDRFMRLDPCAIGFSFQPFGPPPWKWEARIRARVWNRDKTTKPAAWQKSPQVDVVVPIVVASDEPARTVHGRLELMAALAALGHTHHAGRLDVDVTRSETGPVITVSLVNESPEKRGIDSLFYEVSVAATVGPLKPFLLDTLADSFRYDRRVPAYGLNAGVEYVNGVLTTTDFVETDRVRPDYWDDSIGTPPDLGFAILAQDPLPQLQALVDAFERWTEANWSDDELDRRAIEGTWSPSMRAQAVTEAQRARGEVGECRRGVDTLAADPDALLAFKLMNEAFLHSGVRKGYDSWRPFQIGFVLLTLPGLVDVSDPAHDRVDTLWFATGGGKTETYLALVVILCLLDRLRGKAFGISAWSRFPLRMLSLQQTQRFADVLAGAELARRRHNIPGEPVALGYYVGPGTPNRISADERDIEPANDYRLPNMPKRYRLLLYCPFCFQKSIDADFDELTWTLRHLCTNEACPWPKPALPFHVVDDEVYRFLPSVVVGTLDKAAMVGLSANVRGFYGAPLGFCSKPNHGFTYAKRGKTPTGCLVPGCSHAVGKLPQPPEIFAPGLRIQDELHLLADSLGAIDAHYETLLDHLSISADCPIPKIVGSSATLAGFEAQVRALYKREGRSFPMPGPTSAGSFWTKGTDRLARRFVALAPRGQTQEFAVDRIAQSLQMAVRRLQSEPAVVCAEAGVEPASAEWLLNIYGTNVFYGSKLPDVEATARSLESQPPVHPTNVERLTGFSELDKVKSILERLERPEPTFDDRLHVICASAMMSHGVDIDRFNVMTIIGVPFKTSEFIQTSARIGRKHPGLVFVLHRMVYERDAKVFRSFGTFVQHGDRFVEAVAITRKSRNVLAKTMPGGFMAEILGVREPSWLGSGHKPLSTVTELRQMAQADVDFRIAQINAIKDAFRIDEHNQPAMSTDVANFVDETMYAFDRAQGYTYPGSAMRDRALLSLRDVEQSVPIREVTRP